MKISKKGFTLVELLAVITIVGIISLIAVPIIGNITQDMKKKAFKQSVVGIVESTKIYFSNQTKDMDFEGEIFKFGNNDNTDVLELKGKKPVDGEVQLNQQGDIKLYVTDGTLCAFKDFESNQIEITEGKECVKNSETPKISATYGNKKTDTISLIAECNYESGKKINVVKYEFSKDGGKTWDSKVVNGKYLNYYIYSGLKQENNESNYQFKAKCTTDVGTVAEKNIEVKPESIANSQFDVPNSWARSKVATITYPEGRYDYYYKIVYAGENFNDKEWIKVDTTTNKQKKETIEKEGITNIYTKVEDKSGNYITSSAYTVSQIDRTPPECGFSGESTTWRQSGTINATCSDPKGNNTQGSGCTQQTASKSWAYTSGTATTTTANLSYQIEDVAGNTANCSKTANVYVDRTPPTCGSFSGGSTSWTSGNRTISVGCSDGSGSGCIPINFSKDYTTTTKTANTSIIIMDNVGNPTTCSAGQNIYVDKDAPTCGSFSGGSTSWTSGNRTISVGCSDGNGSGCTQSSYSTTYNTTTTTANTSITIRDGVGHTRTCTSTQNIYVDKDAPTCGSFSGGSTSWTSGNRTISVGCSDGNGSGCTQSSYSTTYNTTTTTANTSITIRDGVGHTKTCSSNQNIYIDKGTPTTPTITGGHSGWVNYNQIIWLTKESTSTSGINRYQYCENTSNTTSGCTWRDLYNNQSGSTIDVACYHSEYNDLISAFGGNVTSLNNHYNNYGRSEGRLTSCSGIRKAQNISTNGSRYIFFRAVNNAGTVSAPSSSQFTYIDTQKPNVYYINNDSNSGWTSGPVHIEAQASDSGGSELVGMYYYYDGSNYQLHGDWDANGWTSWKVTGTWTQPRENHVYVVAFDKAGNMSDPKDAGWIRISGSSGGSSGGSSWGHGCPSNCCSLSCGCSGCANSNAKIQCQNSYKNAHGSFPTC